MVLRTNDPYSLLLMHKPKKPTRVVNLSTDKDGTGGVVRLFISCNQNYIIFYKKQTPPGITTLDL